MRYISLGCIALSFLLSVISTQAAEKSITQNYKIQANQNDNAEECPICFLEMDCHNQFALPKRGKNCGHIFHEDCLNMALKKQFICPMCRTKCSSVLLFFARTKRAFMHAFCVSRYQIKKSNELDINAVIDEQLGLLALQDT